MQPKLIIVANRLPVSAQYTSEGLRFVPSPGGMAAALQPTLRDPQTIWIGYQGVSLNMTAEEQQKAGLSPQLIPISLDDEQYQKHYYRVANGTFWPLLHGFKPRHMYTQADWIANQEVCALFADEICRQANPQDIIWIQDFHLFMLPKILRERGIYQRIGFFLHTPFPTVKKLQQIPHYKEILQSLLQADVCGLHTQNDARHMRAALRATGLSSKTKIVVAPVGIDYDLYATASSQISMAAGKHHDYKKVLFSVSRLDYTKGILEQLTAYEQLLAATAQPETLLYKLIVAPSREDLHEYTALHQAIEAKVASINKTWGHEQWTPIDYEYRNVPFAELLPWYRRADIMLVAPLIDGMNLVAKEYIAAHAKGDGILILGKMAGAARQLTDALLVNPRQIPELVTALRTAVDMPHSERQRRFQALQSNVRKENSSWWVSTFLEHLEFAQ